jgi:hypothetical protein
MPSALFVSIVAGIGILKIGIGWYGADQIMASANALPKPHDYSSSGLLGPALIRVLGLDAAGWALLAVLLIAAAVILPVLATRLRSTDTKIWRLALIMFICWPAAFTSIQFLGHYQDVLPISVVIAMISRNRVLIGIGLALAALSNPEQAMFGFIALLIASWAPPLRIWRQRAIAGVVVAALWSVLAHAWLASNDIPSRFEMLSTDLQYSVSANVSAGLTGIYSWWGPWWLLVILLALMSGKKGIFPFLIGAVALPGALTIITVDGTRVFASIAAPIGVAMALSYLGASGLTDKKPKEQAPLNSANSLTNSIALWACALVLLPALMSNVGASTFLSNWQFVVTQVTDRLQ